LRKKRAKPKSEQDTDEEPVIDPEKEKRMEEERNRKATIARD
jgi:hypothetical protein